MSLPFVLLDDAKATLDQPRSCLYRGYVGELRCNTLLEWDNFFLQVNAEIKKGRQVVLLFSYDLGVALMGLSVSASYLARALLFQDCLALSSGEVITWLEEELQKEEVKESGLFDISSNISEEEFVKQIARIKAYIEAGDVYQINYTHRLHFNVVGSVLSLYLRLREKQPVPYGALIALPGDEWVLSFSPELFVQNKGGNLLARPMKGTGLSDESVLANKNLAQDEKNCAENVMIVDLLRNDLSKVAKLGTVHVPRLFDVTRYGEVVQMTSDVCATLQSGQSFKEVMAALYPCGSITGAPKRRAMEIIQECEQIERGMYTGGLGWWLENGDFCLSVVIRTVMLSRIKQGVRRGYMGVGSGIVFDSLAQEEYQECAWKANFLRHGAPTFFLFETMSLSKEEGYRFLLLHKKRLMTSARYFGFKYDEEEIDRVLNSAVMTLVTSALYRAKLSLYVDGRCQVEVVEYKAGENKVRVRIAKKTTCAEDIFLRHKTSVRGVYDAAWREAEGRGEFDQLFFNTEGFLTEGARSSVFVKLDGRWYTPPLEVGVLPGVMRQQILRDPKWQAVEFKLTREDVLTAQEVMVCNALRGVMQAELAWDDEKAE